MANPPVRTRPIAKTAKEIQPLRDLIWDGRLFEAQAWIEAGQPIELALKRPSGERASVLQIAVHTGFYSMVQALLHAGATVKPEAWKGPLHLAVRSERLDLVKLFLECGVDVKKLPFKWVRQTRNPAMIKYFIELGADLETDRPFAQVFISRMKSSIRLFKRCLTSQPHLIEQANIALRHHCKAGNIKWVAAMLWLGADPYQVGTPNGDMEYSYDCDGESAVEIAALHRRFAVFTLKSVLRDPANSALSRCVLFLRCDYSFPTLHILLAAGVKPNESLEGTCGLLSALVCAMPGNSITFRASNAKKKLKTIDLLAQYGAKWKPDYRRRSNERKSLMELKPIYILELLRILTSRQTCSREDLRTFINSPPLKKHLGSSYSKALAYLDSPREPD